MNQLLPATIDMCPVSKSSLSALRKFKDITYPLSETQFRLIFVYEEKQLQGI